MEINDREYPLWSQFVERQQEWVGGILEDYGDSMDIALGCKPMTTKITGITLEPNGDDSAFFAVAGEDFTCGFDTKHGGISGSQDNEKDWLTFSGYMNHRWRILQPKQEG